MNSVSGTPSVKVGGTIMDALVVCIAAAFSGLLFLGGAWLTRAGYWRVAAALMSGRDLTTARASLREKGVSDSDAQELAPHLVCLGNQPSTTILVPALTPFSLGQLMALYEHKVFVQGWIWGINSFDQYGVELGKEMARSLSGGKHDGQDPSTSGLMAAAAAMRAGNSP